MGEPPATWPGAFFVVGASGTTVSPVLLGPVLGENGESGTVVSRAGL